MAGGKEAVSFDEIIQADRKRRQNAELAEEIFGRGRKGTPTGPANRKQNAGPSLASRAGITKASQRSNSSTAKTRDIGEALRGFNATSSPRLARAPRPAKETPMVGAAKQNMIREAATKKTARTGNGIGAEINIRGTAGPYVVIGSNFAPGTTAADIESAMLPVGGEMQSCRIMTAAPTVMAEMVFTDKENAERVIDTFNNKKADGRVLHIYFHRGPPGAAPLQEQKPASKPSVTAMDLTHSDTPRVYDNQREQSDRNRRRAEPEVQDGSYGFDKTEQMDVEMDAPVPLGAPPPPSRPEPPRAPRQEERPYERRDYAPRDYGRSNYDDRNRGRFRGGERPRDDRRLFSDDLYQRPRGRGFR